ncbi:MAG TPA: RDD family protein [Burkholderiales bacterium]|nr:RDD family protein [Burkholderiales bacterium]
MLDTAREIPTPEGIELSLRLAGPVARALAWMIDLVVRLTAFGILSIPVSLLGGIGAGISFILWFGLEWFYPTLFEVYGGGATPGKRALGLIVLHRDGTPVGLPASLTRNLLRAVDFLPLLYGFGLLSVVLSRDFQRLGDIAGGTLVVYREASTQHGAIPAAPPLPPAMLLSPLEQRTLLDLAARSQMLTSERAQELAALAPRLSGATGDTAALARVLSIANYLIGRRA